MHDGALLMASVDFLKDRPALNRDLWHGVHILDELDGARSRGFPPESRRVNDMLGWCDKNARGRWTAEQDHDDTPIFWFEDQSDALQFSLKWFPFKCL